MRLSWFAALLLVTTGCGHMPDNVDCRAGCPGEQVCFVNGDSGRCCIPAGIACTADVDCCVGSCAGGLCGCESPGAVCLRPGACCAGSCAMGACSCSQAGHPCGSQKDCCAGLACNKGICG